MESTSVISQTHFCESFGRPYSEFEAVERSEVFPVVWEGDFDIGLRVLPSGMFIEDSIPLHFWALCRRQIFLELLSS
ncbi:unnamed protein product [Clonostachys rosea f. rosea IK726]|uniref:Uncharacterized protein n=1 Tax=Clonostachys rosea f. rosea IK726 TaxID=1349383 RepID=A0ACA9TFK4_BIOOC|nr:unnamed protein product [Clonostachys rosea f. rosea IK726]